MCCTTSCSAFFFGKNDVLRVSRPDDLEHGIFRTDTGPQLQIQPRSSSPEHAGTDHGLERVLQDRDLGCVPRLAAHSRQVARNLRQRVPCTSTTSHGKTPCRMRSDTYGCAHHDVSRFQKNAAQDELEGEETLLVEHGEHELGYGIAPLLPFPPLHQVYGKEREELAQRGAAPVRGQQRPQPRGVLRGRLSEFFLLHLMLREPIPGRPPRRSDERRPDLLGAETPGVFLGQQNATRLCFSVRLATMFDLLHLCWRRRK
mmetsp:Transcript_6592/g.16186  ORF Transcript_6592/g.16186 Transcript_6592/m.16186 type:complete len:258 (+) Transcript_6592:785-1558(+)